MKIVVIGIILIILLIGAFLFIKIILNTKYEIRDKNEEAEQEKVLLAAQKFAVFIKDINEDKNYKIESFLRIHIHGKNNAKSKLFHYSDDIFHMTARFHLGKCDLMYSTEDHHNVHLVKHNNVQDFDVKLVPQILLQLEEAIEEWKEVLINQQSVVITTAA